MAQIVLPILGTLYFAVDGIWSLPSSKIVIGIIITVDAILGVLLYLGQNRTDGVIDVFQSSSGKKVYSLNLNGNPEDIDTRDRIVFKVNKS